MKKILSLALLSLMGASAFAGYRACILHNDTVVSCTKVDNIKNIGLANAKIIKNPVDATEQSTSYDFSQVDSMVFLNDTVTVVYDDTTTIIINPLQSIGLTVVAKGADVVVSQTPDFDLKDVVYRLQGSSTVGSFFISSNKRYTLLLDGVTLQNDNGPVVYSSDSEMNIVASSTNSLTDGTSAARQTAFGAESDSSYLEGAAIYSKDQITISGSGVLNVNSQYGHGLHSKDYVLMQSGTCNVTSESDGIHANDYFKMEGGVLNINNVLADGIDAGDSIVINGGAIRVNVTADDSKGLKSDSSIVINNCDSVIVNLYGDGDKGIKSGNVTINNGAVKVSMYNVDIFDEDRDNETKGSCIKSDKDININGGFVFCYADYHSEAVRGFAADNNIVVSANAYAGAFISSYKGKAWCYKADGNVYASSSTPVEYTQAQVDLYASLLSAYGIDTSSINTVVDANEDEAVITMSYKQYGTLFAGFNTSNKKYAASSSGFIEGNTVNVLP